MKNCEGCSDGVVATALSGGTGPSDMLAYATGYDWSLGPRPGPSSPGLFIRNNEASSITPKNR